MTSSPESPERTTSTVSHDVSVSRVVETGIRLGLLVLLATWCFQIMRPFLIPIVWGGIIAVALYPAYLWLSRRLGGRQVLAAVDVLAHHQADVVLVREVMVEREGHQPAQGLDDGGDGYSSSRGRQAARSRP